MTILEEIELYAQLYHLLFNRITDAVRALDAGRSELARELLRQAQQAAEEQYVSHGEAAEGCEPSLHPKP